MTRIKIQTGDITKLKVGAVVNAANKTLLGGGGVDGAIHAAAGPRLLTACKKLNGCKTGEAVITEGFKLPAKYIVHTVGPVWNKEGGKEPELLARCYISSLDLAKHNDIKSIAFPAISTGANAFPKEEAASVAYNTVKIYLANDHWFDEIIFIFHSEEHRKLFEIISKSQLL
jgi:O-acetyl-ADP-ribose deacetylase (regulator of RNase III)